MFCQKLKKEAAAMEEPPFPGELGERIFQHISQEAWDQWMTQQTMLINEYRLNLLEPKAQEFLKERMEDFFFSK